MTGHNYHVFEDGSFRVNQYTVVGSDPVIYFGPLKAKLSELFFMGFTLQATGWVGRGAFTGCKVHLVRGREKYLVGKISRCAITSAGDNMRLQCVIRDGAQMLGKASTDHYDPFQQLAHKYPPVKRKRVVMMGNKTLEEFVRDL